FFSAEEGARVRDAQDTEEAFLTIWTAKESIVKATGKGIATGDLRAFTVPVRDHRLQSVTDGWSVAALDPPLDGYYAAVAAHAGAVGITSRIITPAALL
ncbi:MAG: 4'-phosphopantetheinyl transferase superfamily protein, partial [Thermoanaerobaculia bacterium]